MSTIVFLNYMYYYKKYNAGPVNAIAKAMVRIRGSYALTVMFKDYPGEIYSARKDSPMIIGTKNGVAFYNIDGNIIEKASVEIKWDTLAAHGVLCEPCK